MKHFFTWLTANLQGTTCAPLQSPQVSLSKEHTNNPCEENTNNLHKEGEVHLQVQHQYTFQVIYFHCSSNPPVPLTIFDIHIAKQWKNVVDMEELARKKH